MFESRPIWSRNAVKANINIQPDKLKLLLPILAYYMVSAEDQSVSAKQIKDDTFFFFRVVVMLGVSKLRLKESNKSFCR